MGIKKRKYKNGSGPMGYIPMPEEAIADNDIRLARAEQKANNNVWTKYVIPIASKMLQSAISSGSMSKGPSQGGMKGQTIDYTSPDNGASDMGLKGSGDFMDMEKYMQGNYNSAYAAFGKSDAQGSIEVEGGEILDTPMGNQEVKGPSHEQGGVDVNVPAGTKIFSDRLMDAKGKSMAERKKAREAKLNKIEGILNDNTTDIAVKNAYQRKKVVIEQEEQKDLMFQEMADMFNNFQEGVKKYAYGTGPDGTDPIYGDYQGIKYSKGYDISKFEPFLKKYVDQTGIHNLDWGDIENRKDFQKMIGTKEDGIFGPDTLKKAQSYSFQPMQPKVEAVNIQPMEGTNFTDMVSKMVAGGINPNDTPTVDDTFDGTGASSKPSLATGDFNPSAGAGDEKGFFDKAGDYLKKVGEGIPSMTGGDILSLYGDFLGATDPLKNVLENRAGDQPNINHFKNFGKDALKSIEEQKGYIEGQKANALQRLVTSTNASKKSLRGSARGVNTMRALDLASDLNKNMAEAEIFNNFAQQMMQIAGRKTETELMQDRVVMEGENERDIADRKDRDQFYSEKSKALNAKNRGIQEMGKDVNKLYENEMYKNLLNQISKYFKFDKDFNIISIKDLKK